MDASFGGEPSWSWPETPSASSSRSQDTKEQHPGTAEHATRETLRPKPTRTYPPRTCRICLETILPTYEPATENLSRIFNPAPRVSYVSSDPGAGRLISPCKCKGSSRYVHEGCLQVWRHADPAYGTRNFWQCPTCGFRYRLERMRWAAWISSTGTQLMLTVSIFCLAMFFLGFVADPIINFYLDPYGSLASVSLSGLGAQPDLPFLDDEESGWTVHFLKGLASLGLLSFVKVLFAMSPWQWWNLRSSGLMTGGSGRAGATGRDRLASISWFVVLIGVGTFIWAVYKGVRAWSRRWLEKAGERVMDVQTDDVDDEDDDIAAASANKATDDVKPKEEKKEQ
ncbi:MAG: Dicer-like protein 2 [Watsoniomyces obsoletus]|nr:MAG: Dicer-like protein 2 [Watsoniomyces obsoletus]